MKRRFLFFLLALLCAGSAATRAFAEAQWNTNLLQNTIPSNESQFTGWEVSNDGSGWSIGNGWFNSSYATCVMRQTVSLADKEGERPVLCAVNEREGVSLRAYKAYRGRLVKTYCDSQVFI